MLKKLFLAVAILAAPALSFGQTCTTNITNDFGAVQTLGVGGTDTVSLLDPQTVFRASESRTLTCPGVVFTSYSIVGGPQNIEIHPATSTFISIAGGTMTPKPNGLPEPIISDNILLGNILPGPIFESTIQFTSDPLCDASNFSCMPANEPSVIVHGLFGINNQPITFTFASTEPIPPLPGFSSASDTVTLDYVHTAAVTPEPASIMLFGTGLLSIVLLLRKSLLA